MPKVPEQSVVDIDIRKRMEAGMLAKSGRDIRGNDEEYNALMRLCRIANVDPLIHTYEEVDKVIHEVFVRWRDRSRLLGGGMG